MYDKNQYREFWSYCEFFLEHSATGVFLKSFDLISENIQGQTSKDAYVYEGVTRPVLAKNARGIKRFSKDYVDRDKLGRIESASKSLAEALKTNLYHEIKSSLNTILARKLTDVVTTDRAP